MVQNGDSGGVVMVYADYGYMLGKEEKVLRKKIALQIWEGPAWIVHLMCQKIHVFCIFFIVPSCSKCSHDKLSWSCFLCVFGFFPGFESIFEHLNHYFLHLFSVAPGGFWKDSQSILLCYVWCDSCKQFSDWRMEKKNCTRYKWSSWGISSSAFSLPILLPCLRDYLLVWRSWSKDSAMFYW